MPDKEETPKIRTKYSPQGREYKRLKRVYDRFKEMKDNSSRKEMEDRWDKAQKNWEAWRHEREAGEWNSNHFPPLVTSSIEATIAEMSDQSLRPLILPRGKEDKPRASVMRHIFEYTWDVADGDRELFDIEHNMLIFGTAIAQEYYFQDKRMVRLLKDPAKASSKERYSEQEVMEYDDCFMENVPLYDFYIDENARSINRGPYKANDCIRRYVMPHKTFKDFFKGDIWDPFDNAKYVEGSRGDANYYEFFTPPTTEDKSDLVEVLWYWSRRPDDALIIVANDVVLVDKPNIYKHKQLPFAEAQDIRRPNQFYGKGEADLLESIQDEYTLLRRMILDRNHLDIDKMAFVSNRETLSDQDLIARPHGLIPVSDVDSVKFAEYGDIPRSVQLSLEQLKQDAVRVTGIEDQTQSVRVPSTATEAAILKEAVLKRVKMKLSQLRNSFLVDIGRMRVANIIQFYSQPKLEKILGDENSEKFRQILEREKMKGTLISQGKQFFSAKYKEIRMEDRELIPNERGEIIERPIKGFSFFEARPEFFIPVARGGYDIKFAAGAELPVSKPLMQSKMVEMFDRLMPLAAAGIYDPMKIGDALLEAHDLDPTDFKKEEDVQDISMERTGLSLELAGMENQMAINGQPIPAMGTPYASVDHVRVHIAFIKSDNFQKIPMEDPRVMALVRHVMGEIAAITQRSSGAGGTMPMGEVMPGQSQGAAGLTAGMGQNSEAEQAQPGRILGGAQVPTGGVLRGGVQKSKGARI